MENLKNQIVMNDFWASEKVLSRLFKSKSKGSVMAYMLFGEPLRVLFLMDEAYLLFTRNSSDSSDRNVPGENEQPSWPH